MSGPKVKVKLNHGKLKKLNKAQQKALILTAEKMKADKIKQQEIPFDEGTLQNISTNVIRTKDGVCIEHDEPYAERLYYSPEFNFQHTHNKHADAEWWEDYITGSHKNLPKKYYGYFMKNQSGGLVK